MLWLGPMRHRRRSEPDLAMFRAGDCAFRSHIMQGGESQYKPLRSEEPEHLSPDERDGVDDGMLDRDQ